MFKIIVNGRNIDLTEAIKNHVREKLEKLDHHFDFVQEVHVFLSVEKNPRITKNQLAEATVVVNRAILRVETESEDLYGSIDLLVDKIDRVLNKHKTKLLGRSKHGHTGSIRRSDFENKLAEESSASAEFEEEEGVYFTFQDSIEEETTP